AARRRRAALRPAEVRARERRSDRPAARRRPHDRVARDAHRDAQHARHRLHAVGRDHRAARSRPRSGRRGSRSEAIPDRGAAAGGAPRRRRRPRTRASLPPLVEVMLELLVALPILVKAALLGIIEGLTEFLPISSTGHLILASSVLGFEGEKAKMFTVSIQTGAMLAVIWYYRARITDTFGGMLFDARARRFALNVVVAFVPAAALGLLFAESIKERLFHPVPVAIA